MNIFNLFRRIFDKKESGLGVQKLVVGLGNPGVVYENTRHNVGFVAVDFLAKKFGISFRASNKLSGLVGVGNVSSVKCAILKPLTYMNSSGLSVKKALSFYKLSVSDVLVLVDDIYFEPGRIRIKSKGSSGGHNGLKSIIEQLDSDNFARIRIGIGKISKENFDLAKWVVSNFDEHELKKLNKVYEDVVCAVSLVVSGQIDKAMNQFN